MKTKINTMVKSKVSSIDESNLGPVEIIICSMTLDEHEFDHRFIVYIHVIYPIILGLDFTPDFNVGIDWNNQGQLYIHQDHKPLAYSR